ncbi:hypothetical protein HKD37_07G017916 [Glycine soja]
MIFNTTRLCDKITLKTKVYELAFSNTTSMCSLPEKLQQCIMNIKDVTSNGNCEERLLELTTSLYVECGSVPKAKWMTIPNHELCHYSRYNLNLLSTKESRVRYTLFIKDILYFCKLVLIFSVNSYFV